MSGNTTTTEKSPSVDGFNVVYILFKIGEYDRNSCKRASCIWLNHKQQTYIRLGKGVEIDGEDEK